MERVKVLVADDHALLRGEVVALLSQRDELEVVGEAADGAEAIEQARALAPDVVIMDLQMPQVNGLEATSVIRTELPDVHVLVYTISENEADLLTALRYGARGYLLKSTSSEALVQGIVQVAQGGVIVTQAVAAKVINNLYQTSTPRARLGVSLDVFSPEELSVLQLVSVGTDERQMASFLRISEEMIQTHLRSVVDKLHAANRDQAAAYAAAVSRRQLGVAEGPVEEKAREEVEQPKPAMRWGNGALPVSSVVGFGAAVAVASVATPWYLMGGSELSDAAIAGVSLQDLDGWALFPGLPLLLVIMGSLLSTLLAMVAIRDRLYRMMSLVVSLVEPCRG